MTNLGKTLLTIAAVGILASIGLAVRAEREPRKPAAQLTPAQRTELIRPQPPPGVAPAMDYERPATDLAPEDGDGS